MVKRACPYKDYLVFHRRREHFSPQHPLFQRQCQQTATAPDTHRNLSLFHTKNQLTRSFRLMRTRKSFVPHRVQLLKVSNLMVFNHPFVTVLPVAFPFLFPVTRPCNWNFSTLRRKVVNFWKMLYFTSFQHDRQCQNNANTWYTD